ncbi:MAG: aldo/keto reductase [Opitutaceae bacterium]
MVYTAQSVPVTAMPVIASTSAWAREVPPLGFGCCPMGGHGWGQVDSRKLLDAVATALEIGVRLFDTSDIYGLGTSETLLGQALRGRRDEAVIATKFGVRRESGQTFHDCSVEWIQRAVEDSLRRLSTDRIDLYQMHYWDGITPIAAIVSKLTELIQQGKIRAFGITNHDPADVPALPADTKLASYSHQYSLVHREKETSIIPQQHSSSPPVFLSWGSLGQGILSGKYASLSQLDEGDRRHRTEYENFHGERFAAIQLILPELRSIASEAGMPGTTALALRWIVDRIPNSIALVGIKRPEQIVDAARMLNFRLTESACARLDHITAGFTALSPQT